MRVNIVIIVNIEKKKAYFVKSISDNFNVHLVKVSFREAVEEFRKRGVDQNRVVELSRRLRNRHSFHLIENAERVALNKFFWF